MLLEAAQQRRQAGPAADRDDPRAAGEEPLLVDDLDERLVGLGPPERVGQDAGDPLGAEQNQRDADCAAINPRSANGRNWSVSRSMTAPASPVGSRSRVTWRRKWANAEGEQQQARRTRRRSQRLIPMPGRQPAAELHCSRSRPSLRRARGGRPRPARGPARAATRRAPRRSRSSGGCRRCSRCRW